MFADDLNAQKEFPCITSDEVVLQELRMCQRLVHEWGVENQVLFDSTKEAFCILHHLFGSGGPFKLLGVMFDAKLLMHEAIDQIVRKAAPKLTALLRTKHLYSAPQLVQLYKAHVLCVLERAPTASID